MARLFCGLPQCYRHVSTILFELKPRTDDCVWLDESAISCALQKKCIVATLVDLADIHTAVYLPNVLAGHCDKVPTTTELRGSDNLIPEPPNIALSCGQHGPVTEWFMSARTGNAMPVPKTFTLLGVRVCLSQRNCFC